MIRRMTIVLENLQCFDLEREDSCDGYPVFPGVMFCPICCSIWARLYYQGENLYEPRMIPCEAHAAACHPDLRPVAGSLIDNPTINGYDKPLLEALPEVLLRREFELHMKSLLIKEMNL